MPQSNIIINLESLLDLSAQLNESDNEQFIMNSALLSLMGKLKIFRACVLLPKTGDTMKIALSKGRMPGDIESNFIIKECDLPDSNDCTIPELNNLGFVYCFQVKYNQQLFAVICLGEKTFGSAIEPEESHYAKLVCIIIATALQNARNHKSLLEEKVNVEKRNQLLLSLFEMSRDFSSLLSRHDILKLFSYHLMGQLMVSRFAIFLTGDEVGYLPIVNRFDELPPENILAEISEFKRTAVCGDIECSEQAIAFFKKIEARAFAQMTVQGSSKGLLIIGKKLNGEPFTEENLQFIEALGNTAISALENERLFQEEINKKRLENEMRLALDIQRNLLPKDIPQFEKFELAGCSIPSNHVGGDYYDFIVLSETEILFAIADVSGKGMPASLLMANVQAALRALAPLRLPLKELISRINDIVFQNTTPDKFVTFFCGLLDLESGVVEYINAGHNYPILIRKNGSVELLREGGLILGFTDIIYEYEQGRKFLERGDMLVCYTDGVSEAINENGEEFGEKRLIDELAALSDKNPDEVLNAIVSKVKEFAGEALQFDDLTVSVIKATL